MKQKRRIFIREVAAFADTYDAGSPTNVVLDARALNDRDMQSIARGAGPSHTAFMTEIDDSRLNIRFFTRDGELQNCGHATIAAHVLRANFMPDKRDFSVIQHTMSGAQQVDVRYQAGVPYVNFRQNEIEFSDVDNALEAELMAALNLPASARDTRYPVVQASPGANRFLLALDKAALTGMSPDFARLRALCGRIHSLGCFAFAADGTEQASARMFAPAIGVDEDMINANSSGCLGAYLLRLADSPELTLRVRQGQRFNRPGTVHVMSRRAADRIETTIGGTACIVSEFPRWL